MGNLEARESFLSKRVSNPRCKGVVLLFTVKPNALITWLHDLNGTNAPIVCHLNREVYQCWKCDPQGDPILCYKANRVCVFSLAYHSIVSKNSSTDENSCINASDIAREMGDVA